MILTMLLTCITFQEPLPESPKPKPPVVEKLAASKLVILQSSAILFDGITTHSHLAQGTGWIENRAASPFIGTYPTWNKMIPIGIAEVVACEILARKHPKAKWLQVAFIGLHIVAGSRNLTLQPYKVNNEPPVNAPGPLQSSHRKTH